MAYRELRNFKEIMATLGYPRLISIENFKVPHFELVADCLIWLCQRYDKNMEILEEIRTEQDRVVFLKSVAEQLLVKVRRPHTRAAEARSATSGRAQAGRHCALREGRGRPPPCGRGGRAHSAAAHHA